MLHVLAGSCDGTLAVWYKMVCGTGGSSHIAVGLVVGLCIPLMSLYWHLRCTLKAIADTVPTSIVKVVSDIEYMPWSTGVFLYSSTHSLLLEGLVLEILSCVLNLLNSPYFFLRSLDLRTLL